MLTVQSRMSKTIPRCKGYNNSSSRLQETIWSLLGLETNHQAWAVQIQGWAREPLKWLSLIRWLNPIVRQSSVIQCRRVVAKPSAEFKRLQIQQPPTPSWSSKCKHQTKNLTESKIGSVVLKTGQIMPKKRALTAEKLMKADPRRNLLILSVNHPPTFARLIHLQMTAKIR